MLLLCMFEKKILRKECFTTILLVTIRHKVYITLINHDILYTGHTGHKETHMVKHSFTRPSTI